MPYNWPYFTHDAELLSKDELVMVLSFIVMHPRAIKTTTRCAVDVALRDASEMQFYIETGTFTIELSKTSFTVHELSYISRNNDIPTW